MNDSQSLQATEALGGRGALAPRVSLEDINNAIADEYTVCAAEAAKDYGDISPDSPLHLLTLHFIVMRNGFVVVGKSAPASPKNFDKSKGKTFARDDAIRQIWPLMGYALRDRLAGY